MPQGCHAARRKSMAFTRKSGYYDLRSRDGIMGTPDEFRRNAHECVELAGRTANVVHRNMLLGLAVKWHQLASATRDEIALTSQQARTTASHQSAARSAD
jgi:hypothetical protein